MRRKQSAAIAISAWATINTKLVAFNSFTLFMMMMTMDNCEEKPDKTLREKKQINTLYVVGCGLRG